MLGTRGGVTAIANAYETHYDTDRNAMYWEIPLTDLGKNKTFTLQYLTKLEQEIDVSVTSIGAQAIVVDTNAPLKQGSDIEKEELWDWAYLKLSNAYGALAEVYGEQLEKMGQKSIMESYDFSPLTPDQAPSEVARYYEEFDEASDAHKKLYTAMFSGDAKLPQFVTVSGTDGTLSLKVLRKELLGSKLLLRLQTQPQPTGYRSYNFNWRNIAEVASANVDIVSNGEEETAVATVNGTVEFASWGTKTVPVNWHPLEATTDTIGEDTRQQDPLEVKSAFAVYQEFQKIRDVIVDQWKQRPSTSALSIYLSRGDFARDSTQHTDLGYVISLDASRWVKNRADALDTIRHESGHWLMGRVEDGIPHSDSGSVDHAGYVNPDTNPGFVEGFADWAAVAFRDAIDGEFSPNASRDEALYWSYDWIVPLFWPYDGNRLQSSDAQTYSKGYELVEEFVTASAFLDVTHFEARNFEVGNVPWIAASLFQNLKWVGNFSACHGLVSIPSFLEVLKSYKPVTLRDLYLALQASYDSEPGGCIDQEFALRGIFNDEQHADWKLNLEEGELFVPEEALGYSGNGQFFSSSQGTVGPRVNPPRESPPPLPDSQRVQVNLGEQDSATVHVKITGGNDELLPPLEYDAELKSGESIPVFIPSFSEDAYAVIRAEGSNESFVTDGKTFNGYVSQTDPASVSYAAAPTLAVKDGATMPSVDEAVAQYKAKQSAKQTGTPPTPTVTCVNTCGSTGTTQAGQTPTQPGQSTPVDAGSTVTIGVAQLSSPTVQVTLDKKQIAQTPVLADTAGLKVQIPASTKPGEHTLTITGVERKESVQVPVLVKGASQTVATGRTTWIITSIVGLLALALIVRRRGQKTPSPDAQ